MVILNTYPVKAKLKDGIGYPVHLFRIPPKTNFRFETISPGITFSGVLDAAGALALETSLSAARPPSKVVWNGPSADMEVTIPLITPVDGGMGGDSRKFYLDKGAGLWDDRYGVAAGAMSILGGNIYTDYDYYFQCNYPHFILGSLTYSTVSGTWFPDSPRSVNSGVSYSASAFIQPRDGFLPYALMYLGAGPSQYSGPLLTLSDYEFIDARWRLPAGFTYYRVQSPGFNSTLFNNLLAGNYVAIVAEIHDDRHGLLGAKCC